MLSVEDRLWSRIDQGPDCWVWPGGHDKDGYGHIKVDRIQQSTHRLAWTLTHGPVPAGMLVLHHCDNPPCCRPDHLFLGTHADNMRDRATKGRNQLITGRPKQPIKHGTIGGYNAHLRHKVPVCDLCRAERYRYYKAWQQRTLLSPT